MTMSDGGLSRIRRPATSAPVVSADATRRRGSGSAGGDLLVGQRVDRATITAHGRNFTIQFVRKQKNGGEAAIYDSNSAEDERARNQLIARTEAILNALPPDRVQAMNSFSLDMSRQRPEGAAGLNTPFALRSFTSIDTGNVAPTVVDYQAHAAAQVAINALLTDLVPFESVRLQAVANRSQLAAAASDPADDPRRASSSHRSGRSRRAVSPHARSGRGRRHDVRSSRRDFSGGFSLPIPDRSARSGSDAEKSGDGLGLLGPRRGDVSGRDHKEPAARIVDSDLESVF